MKCDTTCIHFPCMRAECGLKWECPMYKSAITQAIEIIDSYKNNEKIDKND